MKKKKNTRNRKSRQRRIEQRQQRELLGKKSCDMKDMSLAKLFGRPLTSEQQLEVTLNQHQEFLGLPQIDWLEELRMFHPTLVEELRKLEPKTGDVTREEREEVKSVVKEVIDVRSLPYQGTHFNGPYPKKRVYGTPFKYQSADMLEVA